MHVIAPALLLLIASIAVGDGASIYQDPAGKGAVTEIPAGASRSDISDLGISSVGISRDVVVLLYRGANFSEGAVVLAGEGLQDLPEDWDNQVRSIRVISLRIIGNPLALLRQLVAIIAENDMVYDLRLLPCVKHAEQYAREHFAQGNEGTAWFNEATIDLEKNELRLTLSIRHRHSWGKHLGRAYSATVKAEVRLKLTSDFVPELWIDLGQGVRIQAQDLMAALSLLDK